VTWPVSELGSHVVMLVLVAMPVAVVIFVAIVIFVCAAIFVFVAVVILVVTVRAFTWRRTRRTVCVCRRSDHQGHDERERARNELLLSHRASKVPGTSRSACPSERIT
jgi:ABC-type transport system involved in Fe-S cluster assembly fused permease/ATPase subunit